MNHYEFKNCNLLINKCRYLDAKAYANLHYSNS